MVDLDLDVAVIVKSDLNRKQGIVLENKKIKFNGTGGALCGVRVQRFIMYTICKLFDLVFSC